MALQVGARPRPIAHSHDRGLTGPPRYGHPDLRTRASPLVPRRRCRQAVGDLAAGTIVKRWARPSAPGAAEPPWGATLTPGARAQRVLRSRRVGGGTSTHTRGTA